MTADEMEKTNVTHTKVLQGKKVAVFGERDDVSGLAVRNCVIAAGAEVVYETTACFV